LKARDSKAAKEAVVGHISKTKTFLQEVVNKLQKLGVDPSMIPINELKQNDINK